MLLRAETVLSLRMGYCELRECFIPYRNLQPILALGETRFEALTSIERSTQATKGIIHDVNVVMRNSTEQTLSGKVMEKSDWATVFESLLATLKEVSAYNEEYNKALREEHGKQLVGSSIDEI